MLTIVTQQFEATYHFSLHSSLLFRNNEILGLIWVTKLARRAGHQSTLLCVQPIIGLQLLFCFRSSFNQLHSLGFTHYSQQCYNQNEYFQQQPFGLCHSF